jgi:hypothetical protein
MYGTGIKIKSCPTIRVGVLTKRKRKTSVRVRCVLVLPTVCAVRHNHTDMPDICFFFQERPISQRTRVSFELFRVMNCPLITHCFT